VGEKPRCRKGEVPRPPRRTRCRVLRLKVVFLKTAEVLVDNRITSLSDEALSRRRTMLKSAFGPAIAEALSDPQVVEVMVNPDGRLWIDRLDTGRSDTGTILQWSEAERIIRLIASHIRLEVHDRSPIVSAELPDTGERFEGLIPPVAPAPCFSIRKPARRVHRLADYVEQSIMPPQVAAALKEAVFTKSNIIVVGGTSSGKTTLVNALLAEVAATQDRVIILEDTRELNCTAEDCVSLRTKPGLISLADLVRSTLRLRPDRIIVGEVRGAEALDMLKAWNTGHPGGLATVHANSARGALYRIEQLVQESVVTVPRRLIAGAIDLLVFLEGRGASRKVTEVAKVEGLNIDGDYQLTSVFSHARPLSPPRSFP
jgi:P-type conjugative transfer ATPase TrbB